VSLFATRPRLAGIAVSNILLPFLRDAILPAPAGMVHSSSITVACSPQYVSAASRCRGQPARVVAGRHRGLGPLAAAARRTQSCVLPAAGRRFGEPVGTRPDRGPAAPGSVWTCGAFRHASLSDPLRDHGPGSRTSSGTRATRRRPRPAARLLIGAGLPFALIMPTSRPVGRINGCSSWRLGAVMLSS